MLPKSFLSQKLITVLSLSLYSIWLLGFLFDPAIFLAMTQINQSSLIFGLPMVAHVLGYIFFAFIISDLEKASRILKVSLILVIGLTLALAWLPPSIALGLFTITGFLGSAIMVSYAYLIKENIVRKDRFKAMGFVLVVVNLGLFMLNELDLFVTVKVAFGFVIVSLLLSLGLVAMFDLKPAKRNGNKNQYSQPLFLRKDLWLLGILIGLITLNGGLMYTIIIPSYIALGDIVVHLWLWPYMLGIGLYLFFFKYYSRGSILIGFTALLGFSFVVYLVSEVSVLSFIVVNLLLMVSLGAFDVFWWGTLSELFDETTRPGSIFAFGMIANLIGVLLGMILSQALLENPNQNILVVAVALTTIFIVLGTFPFLNHLLHNKSLLEIDMVSLFESSQVDPRINKILYELSERELEITKGLIQGRTYKMIGEDLYLSVNTIKFHIRSIYDKFDVNSRFDLIQLFEDVIKR